MLLDARKVHDDEPMIHFNLACYAAQTERLDIARDRLERSMVLEPRTRSMALEDPDLEPLWADLGEPLPNRL